MRIAVTGGAGFIASHLCDALVEAGHELLVIDDLSSGNRAQVPAAAKFVEADIRSAEATAALTAFRPEVLNHHAAQIDVRRSVSDVRYDCDVNIGELLNVLEAFRTAGALKRVVMASSGGAIYDEKGPIPSNESASAAPASPYGVAKRSGELYLEAFRRMYGLECPCGLSRSRPGGVEVRLSVLEASFAAKTLNWRPEVALDEGLRRTVDWFRSRVT